MNQTTSPVRPPAPSLMDRPAIAIISNSHAPYRLHVHQRIAREIPQIKLWSVYTHETGNANWVLGKTPAEKAAADEIGALMFGKGESAHAQGNPRFSFREWRRAGRIIRWIKQRNVRFVAMMGYNDAGRVRIIRYCRKSGIPCWLWGDSNILGDRATGAKRVFKRIIIRQIVEWCDGILCCGCRGREYFMKYGADPNRVVYFPVEPDYNLIRSLSPEAIEAVRRRFALPETRRRLIFSGRLTKVKRPDLLLDAFAAIAPQRPDWDLLVVGAGPMRQALQARLPVELADRVRWTDFLDDQASVSALYRLSDVLVLPSEYEPWALVVNEAAAAGLAIVASHVVGAAAELVRDGVNGRVFPAGDAGALAECLLDVTDPQHIDSMKAASASVLADWQKNGDPVAGLRKAMEISGVLAKEKAE